MARGSAAQFVPEPDQVKLEINIDRAGKRRTGGKEIGHRHRDADQRQSGVAIKAEKINVINAKQGDRGKNQRGQHGKPEGLGIADQQINALKVAALALAIFGVVQVLLFGHGCFCVVQKQFVGFWPVRQRGVELLLGLHLLAGRGALHVGNAQQIGHQPQ